MCFHLETEGHEGERIIQPIFTYKTTLSRSSVSPIDIASQEQYENTPEIGSAVAEIIASRESQVSESQSHHRSCKQDDNDTNSFNIPPELSGREYSFGHSHSDDDHDDANEPAGHMPSPRTLEEASPLKLPVKAGKASAASPNKLPAKADPKSRFQQAFGALHVPSHRRNRGSSPPSQASSTYSKSTGSGSTSRTTPY